MEWLVYGRRRYIPLSAGCDSGPLMTGACAGDGSGAGLRLSKTGICGAGFPRRVVGLRVKPLRPDKPAPSAKPPRARPEVDAPTTQANANTAAKRRFINKVDAMPRADRLEDPNSRGMSRSGGGSLVFSSESAIPP